MHKSQHEIERGVDRKVWPVYINIYKVKVKVYSISPARDTSTQIQYTCTTEVVLIQMIIFQLKMLKNSPKRIHKMNVTLHRTCNVIVNSNGRL